MARRLERREPDHREGVSGLIGVPEAAPPAWLWPSLLIIAAAAVILLVVIWTTEPEERTPEPATPPEILNAAEE